MKIRVLLLFRITIIVLCVLWQGVIYGFSAENSSESSGRSQGICVSLAELLTSGDEDVTEIEIIELSERIEPPLRTLAHMFCFAVLAGLYFLLFTSFGACAWHRAGFSVGCTLIYAVFDEIHQYFVPGRSMQLVDIAVDTLGAILAVCTLSLIFRLVLKRRKRNENSNSR